MTCFKAIAAVAKNGVIGRHGGLPWQLPEDLKWFRAQTLGGLMVVGRTTFEGFKGPLPGRRNLVLSTTLEPRAGVEVLRTPEAVAALQSKATVWICGGTLVYAALLPLCSELLITHIHEAFDGDAYFPPYEHLFDPAETLQTHESFTIVRYIRKS